MCIGICIARVVEFARRQSRRVAKSSAVCEYISLIIRLPMPLPAHCCICCIAAAAAIELSDLSSIWDRERRGGWGCANVMRQNGKSKQASRNVSWQLSKPISQPGCEPNSAQMPIQDGSKFQAKPGHHPSIYSMSKSCLTDQPESLSGAHVNCVQLWTRRRIQMVREYLWPYRWVEAASTEGKRWQLK